MFRILLLISFLSFGINNLLHCQSNLLVTNIEADQILKGNYDPSNYSALSVINDLTEIVCGIKEEISSDSLKSYLEKLSAFYNRNTGSDTISETIGIGATRRWALKKFEAFSAAHENRLVSSYLQFDADICGVPQHRNIFSILPGSDNAKGVVIIEAHVDSRCESSCDDTCKAHGMEDNGSGSALVLELARVMSKYTFPHSIVFMLTIGEEQGLHGADAFSQYCVNAGIQVIAVQNNDVVGGILCGQTSSGPSCPFENHIDSTHVRVFSANGPSRGYGHFLKLLYEKKLMSIMEVPMSIEMIDQEDRAGRGGDHIPFREDGFIAIRFSSANEHGDAVLTNSNYTDRQHTSSDILGVDTDMDGLLDSFFVDFNYLARNVLINAFGATMVSIMPPAPTFQLINSGSEFGVQLLGTPQYNTYRVGVRHINVSSANYDTLYSFSDTNYFSIPNIGAQNLYRVSLAGVDINGVTSIFATETYGLSQVTTATASIDNLNQDPLACFNVSNQRYNLYENNSFNIVRLLPCEPNPTGGSVVFKIESTKDIGSSSISITDMLGNEVARLPFHIQKGLNEVAFEGTLATAIYFYTLYIGDMIQGVNKFVCVQ